MNFVKSTETYHSTDVSHAEDQNMTATNVNQQPQGFGGPHGQQTSSIWQQQMGAQGFNGPQGWMNQQSMSGWNHLQADFAQQAFANFLQNFPQQGYGNFGNFQQQGFAGAQNNAGMRQQGFMQQQGFAARQRYQGPQPRFNSPSNTSRGYNGPRPRLSGPSVKPQQGGGQYAGSFVKPASAADQFHGGSGEAASMHASIPDSNLGKQMLQRMGWTGGGMGKDGTGIQEPVSVHQTNVNKRGLGHVRLSKGSGFSFKKKAAASENAAAVAAANAAAAQAAKAAYNPNATCVWLANQHYFLGKIKRLSMEIRSLKSERPNSVDTVHSAANKAHVIIHCNVESGPIVKGTNTFFCLVQFDGVNVAVASALNKRSAKIEAFDIALAKIMMPYLRVIEIDGKFKELQSSNVEFTNEPIKQTVIKPTSAVVSEINMDVPEADNSMIQKESNVEALLSAKKNTCSAKELSEFLLVEPMEHNSSVNGASILRRSADYSKMLLEYEFAASGSAGSIRCLVRVQGQVLADVVAGSKPAAKIRASEVAVDELRKHCWTILTKQHHDTDAPEITKEEMFSDLAASSIIGGSEAASMSSAIPDSNLGKKLLQKMGWTGGGIGKDGTGIEEPVSMSQVINREGLGLSASKGVTTDFRKRIVEMLESYAASEKQDDLVFSPAFRKEERIIIHSECRRLNLKSTSKGQGPDRFLIVRRKRSANQLLEHIMACGGETARYKLVPPGQRKYPWRKIAHVTHVGMAWPETSHKPNTQASAAGPNKGQNTKPNTGQGQRPSQNSNPTAIAAKKAGGPGTGLLGAAPTPLMSVTFPGSQTTSNTGFGNGLASQGPRTMGNAGIRNGPVGPIPQAMGSNPGIRNGPVGPSPQAMGGSNTGT